MVQQLIINVGVSGSGKTTWSSNYIKNNPNTLRISRDDIRKTLVGSLAGYYQRSDLKTVEALVTSWQEIALHNLLKRGYNVIVDNTTLRKKYIDDIINIAEAVRGRIIEVKFNLFESIDAYTLKSRVINRDNLKWQDVDYIDNQIFSLKTIIPYIQENFKNQIIND